MAIFGKRALLIVGLLAAIAGAAASAYSQDSRAGKGGRPTLGTVEAAPSPSDASGQGEAAPGSATGTATGSANGSAGDPWRVVCAKPAAAADAPKSDAQKRDAPRCVIQQALFAKSTGQKIVSATIARSEDNGEPVMEIGLPHGLLLEKGIRMWVDDSQAITIPIRTADQNGSYAFLALDTTLLDQLRNGTILRVGVTSSQGQAITWTPPITQRF